MARLEDFEGPAHSRLADLPCPVFESDPWVSPKPLSQRRIAIVSTAGLQRRGDHPFDMGSCDFRIIPGETATGDIVMSHVSTNFDRSGFQQDINVALPLDRLRELAAAGTIGSVADYHFSFMGATAPEEMKPHAMRMVQHLKEDAVDTVLLVPI
ncbi:MAG: glycine/sarcosine/betaine reductase selenoprotein B family protein [Hyphomicrobiaceae bacterium]